MSSLRFYFDEHIGSAIVRGVRRRGVDVLTLVEAGKLGATDKEHFVFARQQERVIVTHDTDFLRLAASSSNHAGIIYGPQGIMIGEMVRKITLIA
jgi:predicted nuclease of predicted toxin-antitoxin system